MPGGGRLQPIKLGVCAVFTVGSTPEGEGASCEDRLSPAGLEGLSFDGSPAR